MNRYELRAVQYDDEDSAESYPLGSEPDGWRVDGYAVYENQPDGTQQWVRDLVCPECAGPPVPLGTLGSVTHFRCRDCGSTFSPKEVSP